MLLSEESKGVYLIFRKSHIFTAKCHFTCGVQAEKLAAVDSGTHFPLSLRSCKVLPPVSSVRRPPPFHLTFPHKNVGSVHLKGA